MEIKEIRKPYIVGHHKLTNEPIYIQPGSIAIGNPLSDSRSITTAIGLNGWYNEPYPYSTADLVELSITEGLHSPYTSSETRNNCLLGSNSSSIREIATNSMLYEMLMYEHIPLGMVNFVEGTPVHAALNFKPIVREGDVLHIKFCTPIPAETDGTETYFNRLRATIKEQHSGALTMDDDGFSIDLQKLDKYLIDLGNRIASAASTAASDASRLYSLNSKYTHIRYVDKSRCEQAVLSADRQARYDVLNDIEILVNSLKILNNDTSMEVLLESIRALKLLSNNFLEHASHAFTVLSRSCGFDLPEFLKRTSGVVPSWPGYSTTLISAEMLAGNWQERIDVSFKNIEDYAFNDQTPPEARELFESSKAMITVMAELYRVAHMDILTLQQYYSTIKA